MFRWIYPSLSPFLSIYTSIYPSIHPSSLGTSCSSPTFGGIIGLINDARLSQGKSPVGFLNPLIYEHPEVFTDITAGNNPGCGTQGFQASKGWDPVTGTVRVRTSVAPCNASSIYLSIHLFIYLSNHLKATVLRTTTRCSHWHCRSLEGHRKLTNCTHSHCSTYIGVLCSAAQSCTCDPSLCTSSSLRSICGYQHHHHLSVYLSVTEGGVSL